MVKDLFKEHVKKCKEAVQSKVEGVHQNELALAEILSTIIMDRWSNNVILENSPNPIKSFEKVFEEHELKAIGAIVAIIELVHAVGECKAMPDKYEGFLIWKA